MSIELAAKTKKRELWIAAGGDKMTSVVSIYQNDMVLAGRIVISGAADNDNRYIANVIAAATVGDGLKCVTIDAEEMVFIRGREINPYAIECLLQIIISVVNRGGDVEVLVSCECVRDVLTDVFGRQKALRHSVNIKAIASPGMEITPVDRPASVDTGQFSSREGLIDV